MNTSIKIATCSRASASAKVDYIENTTKADKKIILLEKNDMPPLQTLSLEDKKSIQALQKKISQAEKRLVKAIEDGKEKSINTNQKNINEAKNELAKFENREDKREKYFTEFTISLTNSHNQDYDPNWSKKTLEYIKQTYPELDVISAVEHKGQKSPHMHILLYNKDKNINNYFKDKFQDSYDQNIFEQKWKKFEKEFYEADGSLNGKPSTDGGKYRKYISRSLTEKQSKSRYIKAKTLEELLSFKRNQEEKREPMRQAYSVIQNLYHDFANENIAHNELKTLKKGRKYVSLGQYKTNGNFEVKEAKAKEYEYLKKLEKVIQELSNANKTRKYFEEYNEISEIAQIFYKKLDNYSDEEKNSSFEYVDIQEMTKIDIYRLLKSCRKINIILKDYTDEKDFIEENIKKGSLLDIAKCFVEVGFASAKSIIKINYEKIKNYVLEALPSAKDKNEFEDLMQENSQINYFRFDSRNNEFRINRHNIDLNTLQISAEKIINILDRNEKELISENKQLKVENEQMYEKQEKTPLNAVSDEINDKKQEHTIKKPHRLR